MKVLFWMSTSFQTTSRHLLISVLEELTKAGHQVTVLKKKVGNEREELPPELEGKGIACVSVPVKAPGKGNFVARYIKDIEYVIKCGKYLKSPYDAVFVQSSNVAGVVFRLLRNTQPSAVKTFNAQDIFPDNAAFSGALKRGMAYRLLHRLQGYAYREADHIITISEDMRDLLLEDYGVAPEKISVIYNWSYQDEVYDERSFDREAVSRLLPPGFFHVVYAGNIGVMQNVDVIVEAARLLKEHAEIRFCIIGDGVYRDKLRARAEEYGLDKVLFFPMQPAELAPSVYGLADVNIIPLKENIYKTALPSKTATCMACRRPIIFAIGKDSRFGRRISEETGCLVVDSNDAAALAEAISTIQNDKTEGKTGAFFLTHMSKTENSRRYAELITGEVAS